MLKSELNLSKSPSINESNCCLYIKLLEILDIIVASLVVAPCVVIYWRGTWELLGYYIVLENEIISAAILVVFGISGHVLMALSQDTLRNALHPDSHRLTYFFISRLYTALFAVICVSMWRGSWCLFDIWVDINSLTDNLIITFICVMVIAVTRTIRSLSAAPFLLAIDTWDTYFEVETLFKDVNFRTPGLNMLDVLFSIAIIGMLVIIAWRGLWVIMDIEFFPNNPLYSAFVSLAFGYGSVVFLFIFRPLFQYIYRIIHKFFRLSVTEVFSFICFIGTLNVWRGIWILLDVYSPPEYFMFFCWASHIFAYTIMTTMRCSNSLLVRGILLDQNKETSINFGFFPVFLFQLHSEKERNRRIFQSVRVINDDNDGSDDTQSKQEMEILFKKQSVIPTAGQDVSILVKQIKIDNYGFSQKNSK